MAENHGQPHEVHDYSLSMLRGQISFEPIREGFQRRNRNLLHIEKRFLFEEKRPVLVSVKGEVIVKHGDDDEALKKVFTATTEEDLFNQVRDYVAREMYGMGSSSSSRP